MIKTLTNKRRSCEPISARSSAPDDPLVAPNVTKDSEAPSDILKTKENLTSDEGVVTNEKEKKSEEESDNETTATLLDLSANPEKDKTPTIDLTDEKEEETDNGEQTNEKLFSCSQCEKSFASKRELDNHEVTHNIQTPKKYR